MKRKIEIIVSINAEVEFPEGTNLEEALETLYVNLNFDVRDIEDNPLPAHIHEYGTIQVNDLEAED